MREGLPHTRGGHRGDGPPGGIQQAVADEGLQGSEEFPAALGEPVAHGHRGGRLHDAVHQAHLLQFFQAHGEHPVRQPVDAGEDLAEPRRAAREGQEDGAVPAAADLFDDGGRPAALLVVDQLPVISFISHLLIVSHLP